MTALVSAIIGGLVTALFLIIGLWSSLDGGAGGGSDDTGNVTIKQAPAPSEPSGTAPIGGEGLSVGDVYRQDAPGVVSVDVTSSQMGPGGGSGFVLDETGHIVTNQHVVDGAENISVRFADGARKTAEVVGEDPSTDVAVIRVEAPRSLLEPLTLGDSEALGVGEPVVAIGNPLNVGISVTTGIVSGLGRPITAPNEYTIDNAIQTDAAISSGNSGGPLLDARGTVIGINSQVASAGSEGVAQGVGFAVPINTAKDAVEELITTGEVVHGFIGVQMFQYGIDEIAAVTGLSLEELNDRYGLPPNGALVSGVTSGGPAEDAGISGGGREEIEGVPDVPVEGDVITAVEGEKVVASDDVIEAVNASDPGDSISLTVVTPNEGEREVELTVDTRPEDT
ncbi:trypsin-like serine protease [Rubrobacter tropicus]|uniref:Trypsin-like serine protease n=1 Tax=Rubrobacter tropicus TaxID=2653851 RepID=A0A6G8QBI7_9ACTN|nr:trypsin-like peptidase domain-containing protein [Rubrobacter tropicus]QIN83792.1 trypsin-like serine protease [Rubrobacter tropicus]